MKKPEAKRAPRPRRDTRPEVKPKVSPMPQPLPEMPGDDPFANAWSKRYGCYRFGVNEAIPALNITTGSIIHAKLQKPEVGELVVCHVPRQPGRVFIGHLVTSTESRFIIHTPRGVDLICIGPVLVVTGCTGGRA